MPALLRIDLFDGFRLSWGGRGVPLGNRKACAILGYLALNDGHDERRERLTGLLWSEFAEDKARATLRQAVHEAREAMAHAGAPVLGSARSMLALPSAALRVDVVAALDDISHRVVPDILLDRPRIAETLMAGYEDLDPAFHDWLMARRQTLHDALMRTLEDGYRDATQTRRQRRRIAEAALLLDPTHEEACRTVMLAAAEEGETSAALRAYEELYRLLDEEYDTIPSVPTVELIARIKQGEHDPPAAHESGAHVSFVAREEVRQLMVPPREAPSVTQPPPRRLAVDVAGFGVNGVDAGQLHLVQGFRHHLIACLVCFREWYVADGLAPRGPQQDGAEVSHRYVVEANVFQAGRTIHAVLTLRDATTGIFAWSHPFEIRLDRWFEEQQRIVRRIASSLNVNLSTERLLRLAGEPDVSLEVYDRWLRARSLVARFTPENWNRAATLLAETIDLAPAYSPPYSTLVQMRNSLHIVHPGFYLDRTALERTLELARRAVQLDPRDSRAELCLGWTLALARRFVQAAPHMDMACDLNPNDSWTLIAVALFHAFCGNRARAAALSAHAMEMTPAPNHSYWVYETSIRYLAGDDEGAVLAGEQAGDVMPPVVAWRAAALSRLGRTMEAEQAARLFLDLARSAWRGAQQAEDAEIARWFLQLFPINRAGDWEQLRAGIAGAGVPTAAAAPPQQRRPRCHAHMQ